MSHSPLGLYYFFDGTVVHSDDGPEAARQWVERNEGGDSGLLGAIQPDSSVTFDDPEKPILYFNAKTRYLQMEDPGTDRLVLGVIGGVNGWTPLYAPASGFTYPLPACEREAKLDAYMAAFETVQEA